MSGRPWIQRGVMFTLAWLAGAIGGVHADAVTPAPGTGSRQAAPAVNTGSGTYTEQQASRGETLYRAQCAKCHLENLRGNDMAPTLAGDAFLAGWEGKSVRSLYSLILSTMPSDSPGTLSGADALDIVAFVLQTNGFAAGENELTRDGAETITLTRRK